MNGILHIDAVCPVTQLPRSSNKTSLATVNIPLNVGGYTGRINSKGGVHLGEWIVAAGKNIIQNAEQLLARGRYITKIAGADVKSWRKLAIIEGGYQLRESNLLSMVDNFGFLISKSERMLFANRNKGFEEALNMAFEPVSPVLFPKDYGGLG